MSSIVAISTIALGALGVFLAVLLVKGCLERRPGEDTLAILEGLGFLIIIFGYQEGSILPFIGMVIYGICFLGTYYLFFWKDRPVRSMLELLAGTTLVYGIVLSLHVPRPMCGPVFWAFVALFFFICLSLKIVERRRGASGKLRNPAGGG